MGKLWLGGCGWWRGISGGSREDITLLIIVYYIDKL